MKANIISPVHIELTELKERMNINEAEPGIYKAMGASDKQVQAFALDRILKEFIRIRVSQLNGCGYCVDQHTGDALKLGVPTRKLFAISAWWETPFFTEEEKITLKLAEEVTHISDGGVSDETFENALRILGKEKLAQVIFTAVTINSWNRIAISMHMVADKIE
ncbi:carboxymuconolactone decarboxylase family protein [Chryseolinea sp. T2]|uniref:carboxymuconolactone decarboxylase family protein n=1 Tax=Chryseolinea sp. T2 TaxID=3129255 RepID=UPI003076E5D3